MMHEPTKTNLPYVVPAEKPAGDPKDPTLRLLKQISHLSTQVGYAIGSLEFLLSEGCLTGYGKECVERVLAKLEMELPQ